MKKRLLAGILTVTMLVSLFPIPTLALESQRPEWTVTAFEPLNESIARQTVLQGGGEPFLPDALTAWAYQLEDDTAIDALAEEQPTLDIQQITISGVTWKTVPEYAHTSPGVYLFTPVLPVAYIVTEGVELPTVTVTVEAAREPEQTSGNAEDAPAPLVADALYSSDFQGSGTESDPYCIPDLAALEKFRDSVTSGETYEGKYFKLTADIDLSAKYGEGEGKISWAPIGEQYGAKPAKPFSGTFDGNGNSITNLYIHDTRGYSYQGLFAVLETAGTIKNLTVGGTVESTSERIKGIGGICGWSKGTITDCTNEATVNAYATLGGICGYQSSGQITNCINKGNIGRIVTGDGIITPQNVSGICGQSQGQITDCTNEGTVEGYINVGGICGVYNGSERKPIERCRNTGSITGTENVGGVCGSASVRVEYCSNTGIVTGTENSNRVGGVCGSAGYSNGPVQYCYNTGKVSGATTVGGVCGSAYMIQYCYNTGEVSGTDTVSGVGCGTGSISNCYNTGTVSGSSNVGSIRSSDASSGSTAGCYYLDTSCHESSQGEAKTAAQFASGEVAYRLQGGPAVLKWGQTVGQGLPELTNDETKRVYKVTFRARMSDYAAAYANPNGTVTLPKDPPVSETVSGFEFYGWSKSSNASVPDFTADTQVTGDITVYAMMRKQFGEKGDMHRIETTYGTAKTFDLSKCVKYSSTSTTTLGKFTYSIESGNDTLGATISDDTLTVPGTAPANESGYTLTIKAHEKDPVIFPYSAKPLGTEDFTFTVTVVIKKVAEAVPNAVIDYASEKLTALTANVQYAITPQDGQTETVPADENGKISIREEWMGKTLSIVKAADDNHSGSAPQSVSIPSRPAAPTAPLKLTKTANSIRITNSYSSCEFSIDDTNWNDTGEFTNLTAGTEYNVEARIKATGSSFKSDSTKQAVTTVAGDGSATVKPGESVEIGTDPKTTVTNDGEKVTITTGGGTTTTVIPPTGGEVTPKGDGTVEVPDGTIVKPDNGGPEITVGSGNGGTVGGDGDVTVGGDGKVTVKGEPDNTTITLPSGGGTVKPNPDGGVDVPDGTTVKTGDGPEVTVGPGNGGTIGGNGGVTVPEGGTIQIGKDPATTVIPPKGGEVTPKEDGTVTVPDGTTVKPGSGGPEVTVGPGNGGTVGDDGGVTVEGGDKVTVKGNPDTTITLPSPNGGTVKPNPDGTIPLPGGTVVTPSGKDPITVPDGGGTYDPEDGSVTENVHTVTFDSQGGSDVGSKTATHGGTVANPGSPTRSGYTFGGWYKERACTNLWNFDTDTVTGNITLYAKWTEDAPVHTHSYSSAWSSDANHHWHECSCGEKSAIAAHISGEWIIDQEATSIMAGSRHKACTVCGYIMQTESIPATGGGPSGDNSGGGGGWYNPSTTYSVTTPATFPHGKLTVSPSRAERNTTVTISVIPDDGYRLGVLNVTSGGKAIPLTEKGGGKYTFTMPAGTVKVEATFVPAETPGTPWLNPFADVPEGVWYYDAVRFVSENGLMSGYGNGLFGVNDNLSRAQLAQILFNKEGRPVVNYLLQYGDVSTGTWYTEAVRWATSQGIVGGYGNGNFGPNDPITREQLAVMLWRYSGSPAATNKELHFNDTDEISGFSLEALRWAVENGIINGYGDGRLGPQGQATRVQVAQMLKNLLER